MSTKHTYLSAYKSNAGLLNYKNNPCSNLSGHANRRKRRKRAICHKIENLAIDSEDYVSSTSTHGLKFSK